MSELLPLKMSELLPCPFCGGKVSLTEVSFCLELMQFECADCGTIFRMKDDIWNHRNYPHEVQQAIERMKPMKVIYDDSRLGKPGITEYSLAICPSCRWAVKFEDTASKFCRKCGQALDWSE